MNGLRLIFLFFFITACAFNFSDPLLESFSSQMSIDYDKKKQNDPDRNQVIEQSRRRLSGKKCGEENRRHSCKILCKDTYSREEDRRDCIEDLTVPQVEKLFKLHKILIDPDRYSLRSIDPLDFDVYLNISIHSFEKLSVKYDQKSAESILFWLIENEEIARVFKKEDNTPNFQILDFILKRFTGGFASRKIWKPFVTKLNNVKLMELVIDSDNSGTLLLWFQGYIEEMNKDCREDPETEKCFAIYCKIGDEISLRHRRDWLDYNKKFENYIEDIIQKGINKKRWRTGKINEDNFELNDVEDWLGNLCPGLKAG